MFPAERVTYRDAQSYFAVFADDNNRRPICRFYFNNKTTKSIGIFNSDKNEIKHKIENLDDIFNYQSELVTAIQKYL